MSVRLRFALDKLSSPHVIACLRPKESASLQRRGNQNMIKRIFIGMIVSGWIVAGHEVSGRTLQETVQHTIHTNPEILQSSSNRLAVDKELRQAKADYFPTVDVNLGIGWERSSNPTTRSRGEGNVDVRREEAGVLVRQLLFDGFATPNEIGRQRARVNSRAYTVFGTAENIALNAVEAYLNVLRRQDLVELSAANFALHERTHQQILLRSERGVGRKADQDQSQGRLALAKTNLLAEQGNLIDAETEFLRVIGNPPESLVKPSIAGAVLPTSLEQATQAAIDQQPTLKSAKADVASAKRQHATAKSPYFPRFDIEVGANRNFNLDGIRGANEDIQAVLRMRYNLFRGGRDKARRGETAHLITTAKEIRNLTRRQVEESVRLSWNAYQTVSRQLASFRRFKEASEKTHQAYQKQFNIGRRTLLDLLDSANEMFVARSDYVNADYDKIFNQYRILGSMGVLNESLQVRLPKQATDLEKVRYADD